MNEEDITILQLMIYNKQGSCSPCWKQGKKQRYLLLLFSFVVGLRHHE
jgi:hypothetical protein